MAKRKKKLKKKKDKSLASRIKPVTELQENLVFLVYGRSGTGKTEFGSTFPTPILFIDINERGTETIAKKKGIDLIKITDWDEFDEELYWYLRDGTKYKSIVVDQISNLQDLGMADVRNKANKSSRELFTRKNWGSLSGMMKTAIDNYRSMSDQYNICLIAHERTDDGGDEGDEALEPSIGARVMPSVGSFIDGAVDSIGSTLIKETYVKVGGKRKRRVEYCMRIGPHAFYATKIRRPVEAGPLPELIVNPTYQKIIDLTSGKVISKKKVTKKRRRS